ncbi:amino-acid N-acetyltransferase [Aquiluna borgnonia]|jgi:amino-acid N-acetyltransferase|uniref:Amino-acid N-acetyltransferase n=1 Tax=Aquiluna borgnonia TaxID=2499157 RepID=A0A7D4TJM3_9MICO|nr:amino-acid N-acetyltransferase [Aquiluna borgnonia]QKJ25791.1 amino-acid N-acetyltransferase [Aquiluna borgnonia]
MLLIRSANTSDVEAITRIAEPLVQERILLGKEMVEFYEAIQEFVVAELEGEVVGFGALHVMWRDLAEVRTLAVDQNYKRRGIGAAMLRELLERARLLGVRRVFCLTFEVEFFQSHGFEEISDVPVDPETYAELVRSHDDGVAEFLDLARVKQNTLGNSRMLKYL